MMVQFILFVKDLGKSKAFYSKVLNQLPTLDDPGMVEFELNEGTKLGLMPDDGIAKIICPTMKHPKNSGGIPRCELYLKNSNCHEQFYAALKAGAILISQPQVRNWGDEVSYVADPDGHVIAFAKSMIKD